MGDIYISGNGKRPDSRRSNNSSQGQQVTPQNGSPYEQKSQNPYAQQYINNPYAQQSNPQHYGNNPYTQQSNPQQHGNNPYAQQSNPKQYGNNPYAQQSNPQQYGNNPYANTSAQYGNQPRSQQYNPYASAQSQQGRPAYNGQPHYQAPNQRPVSAQRPMPNPGQRPMPNGYQQQPPVKKKSKAAKIILSILLVLIIVFSSIFAVVYNMAGKINYAEDSHKENIYVNADSLAQDKKVTNILLIGVDGKTNENSLRSDTMLMVSIDRNNKKLKLTSFLRDTWVLIPSTKEHAKLNASFAYGGPQLVIDTIEYNYNVKIDHYMLVGFDMFKTIIDSFGGIDVEVTEKEADFMRRTAKPTRNIQAGPNTHMNGSQALVYCRIRKLDSDFMRTSRQRKVIAALITKAKGTSMGDLKKVADNVLSMVQTDVSPFELTKLAFGLPKFMSYKIESERIPSEGTFRYETKRGQSVIAADIDQNRQFLHNYLYSQDPVEEESTEK